MVSSVTCEESNHDEENSQLGNTVFEGSNCEENNQMGSSTYAGSKYGENSFSEENTQRGSIHDCCSLPLNRFPIRLFQESST